MCYEDREGSFPDMKGHKISNTKWDSYSLNCSHNGFKRKDIAEGTLIEHITCFRFMRPIREAIKKTA